VNNCAICGEKFSDDIRFLNHMMEKHGFRNPNNSISDRKTAEVTKFIKNCLICVDVILFYDYFSLFEKRLFVLRKTDFGVLQFASQEDDMSY